MIGSAGIAALIAHGAFWALLLIGFVSGEFRLRHGVIFGLLWIAGRFGLPFVPYGELLFPSYIAVVDIVLVFLVFKGDVRIG